MKLDDYDFYLPEELIGQKPAEPRDSSKLMVLNKKERTIEHKIFRDIIDYLKAGDVLVRNSTKVIPARLMGQKITGGVHEVFLLKRLSLDTWEVLINKAKKVKIGQVLTFGDILKGELLEVKEDGNRVIKFIYDGSFEEVLDKLGQMPLPPYISEKLENKDRYQTVYAIKGTSVAAPTAGLHFTEELLERIKEKGIEIVDVFLEVGLGTFRPVQTENILEHKMHSEFYEVPEEAAEIINKAKREGRRVIAVGTTAIRTLESAASDFGTVEAKTDNTEIFIYPGYKFKIVDALITNFHLPKSTLLMLVSALSDREFILDSYKVAVENEYKFFSFGDATFIY